LEQAEDPAWDQAFAKYLADLECPVAVAAAASGGNGSGSGSGNTNPHAAALRWLLALALSLDYRDQAAELNAAGAEMEQEAQREEEAAAARVAEAAAQAGDADSGAAAAAAARRRLAAREQAAGAFPDLDAPQVRAEIDRLLRMLRLDGEGGGANGGAAATSAEQPSDPDLALERRLAAARRAVADEVLPTVSATSSSTAAAGAGPGSVSCASLLADIPLGFETGDAAVDKAGALLRLLYLRDLRALQSAVDSAVVEAQEYTANPRTDSSLGRVGR
jgi:RLL motif-containing protein 1